MEVDLITALAVGAIILLIYHYVVKQYDYFLPKPIPCPKPTFFLGNSGPMILRKKDFITHIQSLYNSYPEAKIQGFYDILTPIYMLRDPEVIKQITVKDFDYFMDHTPTMSTVDPESEKENDSLFGNSLFLLRGQKWRDMRSTLSPAFTGSKMRSMFELVAECGKSLKEYLQTEAKSGRPLEMEIKDLLGRFGNDCIATVAFGIKVDSNRDPNNEFYVKGKEMLSSFQSLVGLFKFFFIRGMPWLAAKLKVDLISADLTAYFRNMIINNMKQREAHAIIRNDMIHMLMEVQKGALKHQKEEVETKDAGFATVEESSVGKTSHTRLWSDNELIAQCFLFFIAGFETLSVGASFFMYELALSPEVQQRLYEEILETERSLDGKPLTYEVLQQMVYMDMVVSETLRKWPPAVAADRYCVKDYVYDDGAGTKFVIEKGKTLWLPMIGIHRDPRYYEDPEKFDPERFNEQNRAKINTGAYIPFGIGPRNCIGSRLALMEIKLLGYMLLKEFSFERTAKTQVPLKFKKNVFALQGEKGIWIEFKPRKV